MRYFLSSLPRDTFLAFWRPSGITIIEEGKRSESEKSGHVSLSTHQSNSLPPPPPFHFLFLLLPPLLCYPQFLSGKSSFGISKRARFPTRPRRVQACLKTVDRFESQDESHPCLLHWFFSGKELLIGEMSSLSRKKLQCKVGKGVTLPGTYNSKRSTVLRQAWCYLCLNL